MDLKTILGGAYTPEIEKVFNEAIGKEYIPKEKFDDKLAVIKDLNAKLTERDTQLQELAPKAAGNEALLAQITKLQEENKAADEKRKQSYREKLLDIKIKEQNPISIKALKAELDYSKLSWDDDDNVKGFDEQIQAIKSDEVRKNLLITTPPPIPAGAGAQQNPPIPTLDRQKALLTDARKAAGLTN